MKKLNMFLALIVGSLLTANCQQEVALLADAMRIGEYDKAYQMSLDIINADNMSSNDFHTATAVKEELEELYLEYMDRITEGVLNSQYIVCLSYCDILVRKFPSLLNDRDIQTLDKCLVNIYEYLVHYKSDNIVLSNKWKQVNDYIQSVK